MTTSSNKDNAEAPSSLVGIRISIWEVVFVMVCGGIGSLAGGSIYSPTTVFGAFIGVLLGPKTLRWLHAKRSSHH